MHVSNCSPFKISNFTFQVFFFFIILFIRFAINEKWNASNKTKSLLIVGEIGTPFLVLSFYSKTIIAIGLDIVNSCIIVSIIISFEVRSTIRCSLI